ncbi:DUF3040 domain-containing protein [Actinomycetospora rhizophila]|uniref:DUF3040 domain-containing protein n=1 Tax=Actinomycetospora rhizophila TaxID=1416876 RepID=A0ABV9Z7L0_9PSEU
MERPLTRREQEMLARIAACETDADPAFVDRMGGGPARRPRRRATWAPWFLVALLAVVGVALLVVPGVLVLAAVATAVLVVAPVALIAWALHQGPPRRM